MKAVAVHEVSNAGEGGDFVDDYCELHFVSFTEALGFEKTRSHSQKNLGKRRIAKEACIPSVATAMNADENIVYARTSRSAKLFNGGHQCEVVGVRVVQMITN